MARSVEACLDRIATDGFCVIPDAVPDNDIMALDRDFDPIFRATTPWEGAKYGSETRRFGSLLSRSKHVAAFAQHETVLEVVDNLLRPYCDGFQLNLTQAIELTPTAALPPPHRDQDMWGGPKGEMEYSVTVLWPFAEHKERDGATELWRGSHKRQNETVVRDEDAVFAEMQPGSALIILGSTLHTGGPVAKRSRSMAISYCLGWLKPFENQWLAYPPEVAKDFTPDLARLAGYFELPSSLGNYEGRCPSTLLGNQVPE